MVSMTRLRLPGRQERVHWTGLLDSTAGMVSMTRLRLPGRQKRVAREPASEREAGPPEKGGSVELG